MSSKWLCKVAYTNGTDTRTLAWMSQSSSGTYASSAAHTNGMHTSYHESGERHVTESDWKRHIQLPADLVGVEELCVLTFWNEPCWFSEISPFPKFRKKGVKQVLTLDSREMLPVVYQIRAGVVGSGGITALNKYTDKVTRGRRLKASYGYHDFKLSPVPYVLVLRATRLSGLNFPAPARGFAMSGDGEGLSNGQPFTLYSGHGIFGKPTPNGPIPLVQEPFQYKG